MIVKHRLEHGAALAGALILMASLLFGACLLSPAAALVASVICSAGGAALWLYLDLPSRRVWLPPLVLSLVALVTVAVVELTFRRDFGTWFCVPLAALGSGASLAILLRSRARCALCNRRLGTQSVIFQCPRCSQEVCDATCWNFEHRRCQLCLEQRVPILPPGDSWWMSRTGPRSRHGRCQICLGSAEQVDLRACPNCRRMQCRDCWDFNNGECERCRTPLPDLPASLSMTIARVSDDLESHER